MGATKKTYWVTTEPLEEIEFFEWKSKLTNVKDWSAKPDTNELYESDATFKKLVKACKDANILRDNHINKFNN